MLPQLPSRLLLLYFIGIRTVTGSASGRHAHPSRRSLSLPQIVSATPRQLESLIRLAGGAEAGQVSMGGHLRKCCHIAHVNHPTTPNHLLPAPVLTACLRAEAQARMRLSSVVTVQDVSEAVRLMKVSMQQSSIDPRTGQIDMDLIQTGGWVGGQAVGEWVAKGSATSD